jgi:uncharacterized coiled-coil DUF342 family protein|tara:strand:- start:80 stop:397 length:318 start_codon:yes stop_codon:yes gene_type:complete
MQKEDSDRLRRKAIHNAMYKQHVVRAPPKKNSLCLQKIRELKEQIRILRDELHQCNKHFRGLHHTNEHLTKRLEKLLEEYFGLMNQNEVLKAMAREKSYEGGLGW